MKNILLASLFVLGVGMISCTSSSQSSQSSPEAAKEEAAASASTQCQYRVLADQVSVKWTAFKTTDKIAVSGGFDSVDIVGAQPGGSIEDALKGITVLVNTQSTNSNNPERDAKIVKFFFGLMKDADKIIGDIVAVQGDEDRGDASINLTMNGVTQEILVPYVQERGVWVFQTEIDLSEWGADSSVASLNRACYDLHMGPDGVSKLWPTVRLEVRAPFEKTCP